MSDLQNKNLSEADLKRTFGWLLGMFSKSILESCGCEVNYKINGENISEIAKLEEIDIDGKLQLAVKEERYEDAAILKRLKQMKKK